MADRKPISYKLSCPRPTCTGTIKVESGYTYGYGGESVPETKMTCDTCFNEVDLMDGEMTIWEEVKDSG
jgi:hypothetical protein